MIWEGIAIARCLGLLLNIWKTHNAYFEAWLLLQLRQLPKGNSYLCSYDLQLQLELTVSKALLAVKFCDMQPVAIYEERLDQLLTLLDTSPSLWQTPLVKQPDPQLNLPALCLTSYKVNLYMATANR